MSGILCLHLFSLSPFVGLHAPSGSSGTQTIASFRQLDSQKTKAIRQNMFKGNLVGVKRQASEASKTSDKNNQEDPEAEDYSSLHAPVFLNRNRRKMKQLRKHLWLNRSTRNSEEPSGDLEVHNGLVMRQVP